MVQLSQWAQEELGPLSAEFFGPALVHLTQRRRLADVSEVIQGMRNLHDITIVDEETTKQILFLLRDHIRSVWRTERFVSVVEHEAIEVVLLLESSIWKIFDYEVLEGEALEGNLRDAVEAIVTTEEDTRESIWGLEELLLAEEVYNRTRQPGGNDSDEGSELDDEDDENDNNDGGDEDELQSHEEDEEDDRSHYFSYKKNASTSGRGQSFLDLLKTIDNSNARLLGNLTVKISTSGGETLFHVSRSAPDDDFDEFDSELHEMIYTREDGYQDLPDIAAQLYHANGERDLLYSHDLERHIRTQMEPKGQYDNDED